MSGAGDKLQETFLTICPNPPLIQEEWGPEVTCPVSHRVCGRAATWLGTIGAEVPSLRHAGISFEAALPVQGWVHPISPD